MAGGLVATATLDGFDAVEDWLKELGEMVDSNTVMKSIMEDPAELMAENIRRNIVSIDAIDTGLMYASTYHHTYKIKDEEGSWGWNAGVYDNEQLKLTMKGGKVDGKGAPISAPLTAYWIENGTQAHNTGKGSNLRVKRRAKTGLVSGGTPPRPFIAPAWNSSREVAYKLMIDRLSQEMDKI